MHSGGYRTRLENLSSLSTERLIVLEMKDGPNMTARNNATKTRGRPFQSGNPGRPKGARHKVSRAVSALLEGQHEALTQTVIQAGLNGDMTALRLCLERLVPPRKDVPVALDLPPVHSASDAVAASSSVLAAVAGGELTPLEAGTIMSLLTAHRALVETCELEARIASLENAEQH